MSIFPHARPAPATDRRLVFFLALLVLLAPFATACKDAVRLSEERAQANAVFLAETAQKDVEEVRAGLPDGARELAAIWKAEPELETDIKAARRALHAARAKVQNLRIAKSTFFALASPAGVVLRNDQEQDRMAGKAIFGAYPGLEAGRERYVESFGSLPEASGVKPSREDAQWVAASPVQVDGVTKGLHVTGWSLSAYAYRLEFALRGKIRSEMASDREQNEPLVYVFVVVGKSVYGAPISPDVNREQLAALGLMEKTPGAETYSTQVEITGRGFGLAVRRVPSLGKDIGVAVLRSET